MNAIALIAALYGFGLGILTALGWRLTAGPEEPSSYTFKGEGPRYIVYPPEPGIEFLKGSNFDYLCEWPVEDTRLDWTEDWMARMGRG